MAPLTARPAVPSDAEAVASLLGDATPLDTFTTAAAAGNASVLEWQGTPVAVATFRDTAATLAAASGVTLSDVIDVAKFPRDKLAALQTFDVNPIFAPRAPTLLMQGLQACGKAAALLAAPFGEVRRRS